MAWARALSVPSHFQPFLRYSPGLIYCCSALALADVGAVRPRLHFKICDANQYSAHPESVKASIGKCVVSAQKPSSLSISLSRYRQICIPTRIRIHKYDHPLCVYIYIHIEICPCLITHPPARVSVYRKWLDNTHNLNTAS